MPNNLVCFKIIFLDREERASNLYKSVLTSWHLKMFTFFDTLFQEYSCGSLKTQDNDDDPKTGLYSIQLDQVL